MNASAHTAAGRSFWTTLALSLVAAIVLMIGTLPHAHAAPAVGTVIGNQATATYQDATGTARSTVSNLVQTTVSQVKSFTLTADGAKTAAPGQTVYYPHTLTNTGNGTDTYALNTATAAGAFTHTGLAYYIDANGDGVPDNATPITSTGPIPAGSQFKFLVAGVVPGAATAGQTGTIVVNVSDTATTPNTAANTDTTTVANSVINTTKSLSSTSGPSPSAGPITVTLSYTNSGTLAASNLVLTDALPSGMSYVANSGRWSVSGATALSDAAGGDPAGINYTVTGSTISATVTSVGAGVSGTLTFQVNIASALAPTSASNAAVTTNTATFATSTQTTANTNGATYSVQQTASVNASDNPLQAGDTVLDDIVTVPSASPGSTIVFNNRITNNGNGVDSFDITLTGQGAWPAGTTFTLLQSDGVTSLLDTNGNGTPDTGPLNPGQTTTVIVRVTLPGSASGGPFNLIKTATSRFNPAVSDTVTDRLVAITPNTVDLTNDTSVAGGATAGDGLGSSGATVIRTNTITPSAAAATASTFRVFVNNTSGVADSYDLSLASALPTGWTLSFAADGGAGNCSSIGAAITNTGSIAAGGSRLVCAIATAPAVNSGNAAAGNYDFALRAQSAVSPGISDTIVDRVTVNALHSMTLTPNGTQQTFPGGAVTYMHTLRNNGNVIETASFPAGFLTNSQVAAGWTSAAYIDSNGDGVLTVGTDTLITTSTTLALAANASSTLFVRVFAPASATSASPADVTTLTVTYNAGAASTAATDTTSVTDGLLLGKDQVAVSCAAPGPHSGYSTAAIPAGANTAPGQCIAYRITATNTTAASITSVVLSDTVPANTTRADSCGAPAATGGASVGGTAANGGTGTVTATLAALAPTASFQLTFCARINP